MSDPKSALIAMWENSIGGATESVMGDGLELAILDPLCRHPKAALCIVAHVRVWDSHLQRKIAATIVGRLGADAPATLLDEMLDAEGQRDRAAEDTYERLTIQSVVEDIVFAAVRWCRSSERRDDGAALLRRVVNETLGGQYWNTASYAIATLCLCRDREARSLLQAFDAFARGMPPDHPSRPALAQERDFATRLMAGDEACMSSIERHLRGAEAQAAAMEWDEGSRAAIAQFMDAASKI